MIVSKIEDLTRNRCKITLEDGFAFVLYKGELRHYGIRSDEEIEERILRDIMGDLLPKRGAKRAMALLMKRDYTRRQLREKLSGDGYPEEVIDSVMDYLDRYHYMDDLRYASDYIACYGERKPLRMIEMELNRKGIDKSVIEQAMLEWQDKEGGQDQMSMILELLEKKHYSRENTDRKEQQRLFAFLQRKGFPTDLIFKALNLE